MSTFLYGVILQCKLDIRSRSLLVTCYLVPLLFFMLMGGIFTSVTPEMKDTLIQSMTVMGVSMGALIGLPPSIVETYGGDIKKVYKANGVPLSLGLISMFISTFFHLMVVSVIMLFSAPIIFDAKIPENILLYFVSLAIFIVVSSIIGCILGLIVKNQAKLTMASQILFLPSIMLSGIMFPSDMLPSALEFIGKAIPATWGFRLMLDAGFKLNNLLAMLIFLVLAGGGCFILLKKQAAA